MRLVDFILLDGTWIYVNPAQIAAIAPDKNGGTELHINGTVYRLKKPIDMIKGKLREADCVIP